MRLKNHAFVLSGILYLGVVSVLRGEEMQETGFVDKVYTASDGYKAKYVAFIPHTYNRNKVFPVILFLHGSGYIGTDGRDHLKGALAKEIRKREKEFAFIALFPQAHVGDWQADSPDGKRALAILDEVEQNYKVDTKRVYLTGLSMGGEGTWSLAAAYPNRWAAIVPIAGGGDTKAVAKFKHIPCWCFQGDADELSLVRLTREMIRALKAAGSRPLYTEYRRVGHDAECWDRTYSNPVLYEWLLLQKRP